jgi:hypothetical protein
MAETKKRRPRPKRGKTVNWESPNWEPLLRLARVYVGEFMWMGEVQLKGGISLHLYKHWWTRRYLNPEREWLEAREAREEREGDGIPGYTDGHGEGDGLDAR